MTGHRSASGPEAPTVECDGSTSAGGRVVRRYSRFARICSLAPVRSHVGLAVGRAKAALTDVVRTFYAFLFDHSADAALAIRDRRFTEVTETHTRLWSVGDPDTRRRPP